MNFFEGVEKSQKFPKEARVEMTSGCSIAGGLRIICFHTSAASNIKVYIRTLSFKCVGKKRKRDKRRKREEREKKKRKRKERRKERKKEESPLSKLKGERKAERTS